MATPPLPPFDLETLHRVVFEQHPQPMWVYDPASLRFLAVNNAATTRYGYTRAEFLQMTIADIRPADELARLHQVLAAQTRGTRRSGSGIHRTKAGERLHVVVDSQDMHFAGTPAVFVLVTDVTAQKDAEERLEASERRFQEFSDSVPFMVWTARPDGTVDFVNKALVAYSGMSRDILPGHGWVAALHPDDVDRCVSAWTECVTHRTPYLIEYRLRRADGDYRWFRVQATAVNAGSDPLRWYGTAVDIDDLIRLQLEAQATVEAMRVNEERFRLLARATNDAIWDWNLTSNILWWSEGFETLFGFNRALEQPSIESWSKHIHPDDRDAILADLTRAIHEGHDHWSGEYRYQRKDESYAFVLDRGYVIREADGRAVRMVGGMTDISERKQLEAKFLHAQRMESVGTLAGGIAHDLNNTLAPILMAVELLKEETSERSRDLVQTIEDSAKRSADLLRQVLTFARGASGERVTMDLTPLVTDIQKIARETFPRNITVDVRSAPDLWPVSGDPTQLHQVLMNLAVNARDAMPKGGTLQVQLDNVRLDATSAGLPADVQAGAFVRMRVQDTGTGIPLDVRDHIFEPFFTTKAVGKGTGLGLSTTMTIVRGHGGMLSFETESGVGTTFIAHLPAVPGALAAADPHAERTLPRGHGELVLVVDDEESIRRVVQSTLERFGYRVLLADNGAEAMAAFVEHPGVAVVLTDMMMPVMDGPALITELHALNPEVRIIGSSGLASGGMSAARVAGTRAFVAKPYTTEAILRTLRDVLDAR